jgi:hypothetical protein
MLSVKNAAQERQDLYPQKGWMLAPLGSTMETPEIEPTLVCAKDHTDWFSGLEKDSLVNMKYSKECLLRNVYPSDSTSFFSCPSFAFRVAFFFWLYLRRNTLRSHSF